MDEPIARALRPVLQPPAESLEKRTERLRSFVELAYQTGHVFCAPGAFGAVVRVLDELAPKNNTASVEIHVRARMAPGTMLTGSYLLPPGTSAASHIGDR